jgi:hypothetical protein
MRHASAEGLSLLQSLNTVKFKMSLKFNHKCITTQCA